MTIEQNRENADYTLFDAALSDDHPLRSAIAAKDEDGELLRAELKGMFADREVLSDADIVALCNQAAIVGRATPCENSTLTALAEAAIYSRESIIRDHLESRRENHEQLKAFVYGHTHLLEETYCVDRVEVANSGAFQRVIDDADFRARIAEIDDELSPGEALRTLSLEDDLLPCFTVVLAEPDATRGYRPTTKRWWHPKDAVEGKLVSAMSPRCFWQANPPKSAESRC